MRTLCDACYEERESHYRAFLDIKTLQRLCFKIGLYTRASNVGSIAELRQYILLLYFLLFYSTVTVI